MAVSSRESLNHPSSASPSRSNSKEYESEEHNGNNPSAPMLPNQVSSQLSSQHKCPLCNQFIVTNSAGTTSANFSEPSTPDRNTSDMSFSTVPFSNSFRIGDYFQLLDEHLEKEKRLTPDGEPDSDPSISPKNRANRDPLTSDSLNSGYYK